MLNSEMQSLRDYPKEQESSEKWALISLDGGYIMASDAQVVVPCSYA